MICTGFFNGEGAATKGRAIPIVQVMSGETILIIDDSKEIVKHLTEFMLPAYGYQTLHAFDGETGLQLIRDKKPDLVMLDLHLPEMTGTDILQQMTQESLSTPVVLMTGYGSEQNAIDAFRLGVKDYIIKPFTVDEIVEAIDRALMETRLLHDKEELAEQLRRVKVEMSRQSHEMETLSNIGKAITSLLSVDKVLQRVLEAATQLTDAEDSTIWMPDESGEYLHAYAIGNKNPELENLKLSVSDSQVGQVLQTGRPLRQSRSSGQGIKVQTGFFARAILFVPLKLRGLTLGVLGVSNRVAFRAFSRQDEFLLSFLADYAAIALENARVFQAADQALAARLVELNVLDEITRTITSTLELEEVVRLTIKQVHDSWRIEASSLWWLDASGRQLKVLANVGTPSEILHDVLLPIDEGIVGAVARTGKWIYTNDVATHPLHFRQADELTGFQTRSLLCVPLLFRGQVVGAMELLNKIDSDFNDQDVEQALSIASAVAIAVTNALLFQETEARKQYLETTKTKNRFVTTISYDLHAPLNQINSLTRALNEAGPLNVDQAALTTQIGQATEKMFALVDDLLELAKANTDLERHSQPCDLLEIAAEVVEHFQKQTLARRISLTLTAEPGNHLVQGHCAQLRRALSNLVDNAVKQSPADEKVEVILSHSEDKVLIQVRDQGEGIAEADIPHIFDAWEKENQERDESGPGLPQALSIAEAHGGRIWVESENGDGRTFLLELPLF